MFSTLPALIICSNQTYRDMSAEIVRNIGLQPVLCPSLNAAHSLLVRQRFQFVLCGDDLPDCDLRTALKVLLAATENVPVIVLSRMADWDAYMSALSAGAFDYIACPPEPVESERILRLALGYNPRPHGASFRTAA